MERQPALTTGETPKQHKEKLRRRTVEQARRTRSGLTTFLFMADWALRLSMQTEPDRRVRQERQKLLRRKWRQYTGDLVRLSYTAS